MPILSAAKKKAFDNAYRLFASRVPPKLASVNFQATS